MIREARVFDNPLANLVFKYTHGSEMWARTRGSSKHKLRTRGPNGKPRKKRALPPIPRKKRKLQKVEVELEDGELLETDLPLATCRALPVTPIRLDPPAILARIQQCSDPAAPDTVVRTVVGGDVETEAETGAETECCEKAVPVCSLQAIGAPSAAQQKMRAKLSMKERGKARAELRKMKKQARGERRRRKVLGLDDVGDSSDDRSDASRREDDAAADAAAADLGTLRI